MPRRLQAPQPCPSVPARATPCLAFPAHTALAALVSNITSAFACRRYTGSGINALRWWGWAGLACWHPRAPAARVCDPATRHSQAPSTASQAAHPAVHAHTHTPCRFLLFLLCSIVANIYFFLMPMWV